MSMYRSGLGIGILILGLLVASACTEAPEPSPWQAQAASTDASFRDVFFLDQQRGWLVGGGYPIEGGILGETRDGGASWVFRTGLVAKPGSRLYSLRAIHFPDSTHGVIAASDGWILRSVDGGEHWHRVLHAGRTLSALFFLPDELSGERARNEGWAVGEGWVLRTTDGGASWERMNPHEGPDQAFRALDVHFLDRWRGWLVGHHGRVRSTSDAGKSWQSTQVPEFVDGLRLNAVTFSDAEHGWIVGEAGSILHTRDAGQSWTRQESPVVATLTDVAFPSAEQGWIVGHSDGGGRSTILTSRDLGETWVEEAVVEGEALESLFFHRDGRGWAVGERSRRRPQRLLRYAPPPPLP